MIYNVNVHSKYFMSSCLVSVSLSVFDKLEANHLFCFICCKWNMFTTEIMQLNYYGFSVCVDTRVKDIADMLHAGL